MKRGEVVLVDFPFADGSGSKNRPAVVAQADSLNGTIWETILATITTNSQPVPTAAIIELHENPRSGLRLACAVRCENLQTIDQRLVLGSVGHLSKRTMQRIDACLKFALGLQ